MNDYITFEGNTISIRGKWASICRIMIVPKRSCIADVMKMERIMLAMTNNCDQKVTLAAVCWSRIKAC